MESKPRDEGQNVRWDEENAIALLNMHFMKFIAQIDNPLVPAQQ